MPEQILETLYANRRSCRLSPDYTVRHWEFYVEQYASHGFGDHDASYNVPNSGYFVRGIIFAVD
ncbi:hypothetical protein INS49_013918 [Diaporthe citri]|uniref:uncharacterized protein n=1 Tax=Diaporthe citri TaxID=83186 RepID=UPI001C7F4D6B|nr:uncharacterized protein INS49_013918 [Diaporthe citri]KAG6358034.1 hypothetical protein INS49_013918 [Diaporthe citri]